MARSFGLRPAISLRHLEAHHFTQHGLRLHEQLRRHRGQGRPMHAFPFAVSRS